MIITARAEHLQQTVDLSFDYFAESRFSKYGSFNDTQAFGYYKSAIIDPMRYFDVLVIDDEVKGFLIAFAGPQAWSSNLMCNVALLYITPEHRGQYWANAFIDRVEAWAAQHKMDEVLLGDYAMSPERTRKLTERLGYETVGYIGAKRIDADH